MHGGRVKIQTQGHVDLFSILPILNIIFQFFFELSTEAAFDTL